MKESLMDIAKRLYGEMRRPYFSNSTGIFKYMDFDKDPDYMKYKGYGKLSVNLTPEEYYNLSAEGFNRGRKSSLTSSEQLFNQRDNKTTKNLANKLRANVDSIYRPSLDYGIDYRYGTPSFSQEGLHRMQAGKRIGLNYIPTDVYYDLRRTDEITNKFAPYNNRVIPTPWRTPSLPTVMEFGNRLLNRTSVPLMIYEGLSQPVARDEDMLPSDLILEGGIKYFGE